MYTRGIVTRWPGCFFSRLFSCFNTATRSQVSNYDFHKKKGERVLCTKERGGPVRSNLGHLGCHPSRENSLDMQLVHHHLDIRIGDELHRRILQSLDSPIVGFSNCWILQSFDSPIVGFSNDLHRKSADLKSSAYGDSTQGSQKFPEAQFYVYEKLYSCQIIV